MYGNNVRPIALFTLLMACHDRLATKERLHRFGFVDNNNCIFCRQPKTLQHLMFNCIMMSEIWQYVIKWLQIAHSPIGWNEQLTWVTEHSKGKGWKVFILKCAFVETVYEVWEFRNAYCFGKNFSNDNIGPKNETERGQTLLRVQSKNLAPPCKKNECGAGRTRRNYTF